VLARIQQHIAERDSHFAWSREGAVVIASLQHGTSASEDAIHRARQPRSKALDSVRQRTGALRFDEQVHVIVLQRKLDDAKVGPTRHRAQGTLHFANQAKRSQRGNFPAHAERDQARMSSGKR
jgi:hypothetical protein